MDATCPLPTTPARDDAERTTGLRAIAFLFGAAGMAFVQSGSWWFAGNDSYYHLKMARLLPETGFLHHFPWLHWTFFRDAFVSHHHGFHVLLAPFAWASDRLTGDLLAGGKLFSILAMGTTAALLEAVLAGLKVRHRVWWVVMLALLPAPFWLRQSYVRAPCVALPLLLTTLLFMIRGRAVSLAVLGFSFAHVYGGSVLFALLPTAFWTGARLARDTRHFPNGAMVAALVGFLAGMVVNPYFPGNVSFLRTQLLQTGLGAPSDAGIEWRPYSPLALAWTSAPIVLVWAVMFVDRWRRRRRLDAHDIALLLLNVLFLALTLKARRFIEYWPVFALLSAASLSRVPDAEATLSANVRGNRLAGRWMTPLLGIVIFAAAIGQWTAARRMSRPHRDYASLKAAMNWLEAHSSPGARVFTDDWDIFPAAFFFNHHNTYCVGLDPVFTQAVYPALWERYALITQGKTPAALSDRFPAESRRRATLTDIADEFGADFVLVDRDHRAFYRQMIGDPSEFERVYPIIPAADRRDEQPNYTVFRVNAQSPHRERVKAPG